MQQKVSAAESHAGGVSVASIILSMGLAGLGNGLITAWMPLRLAAEGFQPWVAGTLVMAVAAGGLLGCFVTGAMVRRASHARSFTALAALEILTMAMAGAAAEPLLWIVARFVYGFAITGLFIVSQSWLNDAADNRWRGRVIATFYMVYVLALGCGGFLLTVLPLGGAQAPLTAIGLIAIGILPVAMTRLPTPPAPETVEIALARVWRISPVGLAGMFVVGGLTMLIQGFLPIYAAAEGMPKADVGLLLLTMQAGMIAVQVPLGALSDRMDRRHVLIGCCVVVVISATLATRAQPAALVPMILVFAVWLGSTEAIYSIAMAHANDRADPGQMVSISGTMMVAWSVSAIVLPSVATVLTPILGPRAFMYVAIAAATLYGAFVVWRVRLRDPVPEDEQIAFQPLSAQAPRTAELAPQQEDE